MYPDVLRMQLRLSFVHWSFVYCAFRPGGISISTAFRVTFLLLLTQMPTQRDAATSADVRINNRCHRFAAKSLFHSNTVLGFRVRASTINLADFCMNVVKIWSMVTIEILLDIFIITLH